MIGPTTRLFGLVMTDPATEGHVARLYNYLFGFNGLDAAYLTFLLRPEHLHGTLEGFRKTAQTEVLQVVPAYQAAVARWLGVEGAVESVSFRTGASAAPTSEPSRWLQPDVVCARALRDAEAWFGRALQVPPDWADVVHEKAFRPCKLTHDHFEEHHRDRRTP